MDFNNQVCERHQIPQDYTWDLTDLYPSDEAWHAEANTLEKEQEKLQSYAGKLAESGQTLFDFLKATEDCDVKVERLANYAMRKADEDTRDGVYQAMSGNLITKVVGINAATSFQTPEIMALSDEKLEVFYVQCPALERYRRLLTELRRRKDHVLSEAEERLLAATGEMAQTPDNLYGTLTNSDMTFQDAVDGEGKPHKLTQGTFISYQQSPDRQLRKSAYENLYAGFSQFKNTTAGMLDSQNKQLKFFSQARKYNSALEASLDATGVPVCVYTNLIDAVHENLDKMHRYVRLRKKLLGVEKLYFYDIYTPLVQDVDRPIAYEEAKNTVYDAVAPLGEDYQKVLKEGFDNRWIDVYQNVGKRSGAYSAGAHVHPYVLLNYDGTLDSQFTLAHEMGHALHSYYSNLKQTPVDSDYVIFVAEVASTCNEALLMEYLLGKTTDKKERAYLINHFLEQFKGTIYRQTMFAEFEMIIGNMVREGQTLTADVLCQEYRRLNELYFGPDMVVDEQIAVEWARIPHFYYNYYVFQYATGYAAAIALSRRILDEGEAAVKDYLNFLSGGCSKNPIDLLKDAGVDMTSAAPINQALALFGKLLDEMEELMED